MSAAALGRALHVPATRVRGIVRGDRPVTADTALRLGQWFGTGPELWLTLQKQYELRRAELEVGEVIRASVVPRGKAPASPAA